MKGSFVVNVLLANVIVEEQKREPREVWMRLMEDVYTQGFCAEFAEFLLENPGLSVFELDRQFRNEWDL